MESFLVVVPPPPPEEDDFFPLLFDADDVVNIVVD